jgi:predicted dienelactone hydrolase
MPYDPFSRGRFPVGVRTFEWSDAARGGRLLPTEVWYPAREEFRGQDTDPARRDAYELVPGFPPGWQEAVRDAAPRDGSYPLVLFSHGFGGHRRQSTFLCTHLASHGYLVAAMDHTGNTIVEMVQMMMASQAGAPPPDAAAMLLEMLAARPADVVFAIDRLLEEAPHQIGVRVDAERIGMSGHSFGGWTTLVATARDRRIRAALPLAPAGGWTPLPSALLTEALDFAWGRDVPTLFLVAELDTILPLRGMVELYDRTVSPKKMVVLREADHMHFCDQVEQVHELFRMMPPPVFDQVVKDSKPIGELCAGEAAYRFTRGLGLAHMDAHLKGEEEARRLLEADLAAALATQGVSARVA